MKDVYFAYTVGGGFLGAAILYLLSGGEARSDRVERVGGTVLLGKSVMSWTYWMTEPVVRMFVRFEITANMLTWASLVLGLGAAVALAVRAFGLACLLATCSTIGDILDGQVARHTHTGSDRGELLDAAVDRYTELAFVAGFVITVHGSALLVILGLAALQACMMVSYATAKAEALGVEPPRGLMRRHERAAYMITGVGFSALAHDLTPAIAGFAIIAVIGNLSAIRRLIRISAALP
jgi:phosphatidylglycerophosphate synthase